MIATLTIGIGFLTGLLSGAFGIGGAILSTPALRLILKTAPLIAVGTTLPAVLPAALSGGYVYYRADFIDWWVVKWCGVAGILGALIGSTATDFFSPHLPLIVTAVIVFGFGLNFIRKALLSGLSVIDGPLATSEHRLALSLIGIIAGIFSGFLGIGGGIILIPAFVSLLGLKPKEAFGNSLIVISIISIPGSVVHYLLGHIDPWIALWLTVGIVPGARIGALLAVKSKDRTLLGLFGLLLVVVGAVFFFSEISATP